MSFILLTLRRLLRNAGLLALLGLGLLMADTLIGVVPLYSTLITDAKIQAAISTSQARARNIETLLTSSPISAATSQFARPRVERLIQHYLGPVTTDQSAYYLTTPELLLTQIGDGFVGGENIDNFYPGTPEAFDYGNDSTSAAPHMRLLAGRFPHDTAPGQLPEILITQEMSKETNLGLGQTLTFGPLWKEAFQYGAPVPDGPRFRFRVVGMWEPRDANDPYWNGLNFSVQDSLPGDQLSFPILMTTQTLLNGFSAFPNLTLFQHWVSYLQSSRVSIASLNADHAAITRLRNALDSSVVGQHDIGLADVNTELDHIITNIQGQQNLLALPLYVMVAQIVGLALLYVAALAMLLIEQHAEEIAILRSRGASHLQLLALFSPQGITLSLLMAVVSPLTAAAASLALVRAIIPASTLASLSDNALYFAQQVTVQSVLAPTLAGALVGALVVCLATWQATRSDILAYRRHQGRVTYAPFWRRYYLDLGLAVLCGVGYLELSQFGSATLRLELGESADLLLLLAPSLLLLAGALLVLRLVPLVTRLGEQLAARGRGLTPLLALTQVKRAPRQASRSILLLTVSVGFVLFALTFSASLRVNTQDRIAYQVGADVRVTEISAAVNGGGSTIQGLMARLPGAQAVTQVYRSQAETAPDQSTLNGPTLQLLAIDPATFASVVGPTSWRSDYANQSLNSLMQSMRSHALASRGAGSGSIGSSARLWALVSQSFAASSHLRVGSAFTMQVEEQATNVDCRVGAIIAAFPTLYPQEDPAGFVVVALPDLISVTSSNATGPNEFWLRDTAAQDATLRQRLAQQNGALGVQSVLSRRQELATALADPLTAGLEGLLLLGAGMAAALAILGAAAQTLLAARQRATQFAVLRTLGLRIRDLTRILQGEYSIVYLFGLLGGALVGALLTLATAPYLQFSDPTLDPAQVGVPALRVTINWAPPAMFFLALLLAAGVTLWLAGRLTSRHGLGQALRISED